MGIIVWIVFGLLVGIVAQLLMPGRNPGGFIVTVLLGIAGALLGGFIGRTAGWYRERDPVGFATHTANRCERPTPLRRLWPCGCDRGGPLPWRAAAAASRGCA